MSLVVVDPGWGTRVVDFGRPGTRRLGVPLGGAADRAAWMLGNALVGNPPDAPALEICLKGPTLRAECELAGVVCGAPFVLSSSRQALRANRTFTLSPGEELHIGGTPAGLRAFVCIQGGVPAATVLGSRSTLEPLPRGTTFACTAGSIKPRFLAADCPLLGFPSQRTLAALPGPQADWFDAQELYGMAFTVGLDSNRMGLRLEGTTLTLTPREMVSEPVCPGSVQVTRDGQAIILGVDGQTIGGYPKIAQVCSADLDALGQMRPGDTVSFERIDLEKAQARWQARERVLQEWLVRARVSLGR
jgi:antagonist of KipI